MGPRGNIEYLQVEPDRNPSIGINFRVRVLLRNSFGRAIKQCPMPVKWRLSVQRYAEMNVAF
jgi:hypothetical protein